MTRVTPVQRTRFDNVDTCEVRSCDCSVTLRSEKAFRRFSRKDGGRSGSTLPTRGVSITFLAVPGLIQSIERAAAVLRLLARGSGHHGLSEIADSLGLARGTAH